MRTRILLPVIALACATAHATEYKATKLPEWEFLKGNFYPSGDSAWIMTGQTAWPARITATAVAPGGRLLVGDDEGQVGLLDLASQEIVCS